MTENMLPEWVTARHSEGTATGGVQVYKAKAALALSLPFSLIYYVPCGPFLKEACSLLRYKFDGAAIKSRGPRQEENKNERKF